MGYMLLDAWTANQDRHHENWAAITGAKGVELAPTFDHGSALARNLTDAERNDRLTTADRNRTVQYFASRALSEFFPVDGLKPLPLLNVFHRFAALDPDAAEAWLERLSQIQPTQVDGILGKIPPERMTPVTRRFTLELLTINQAVTSR